MALGELVWNSRTMEWLQERGEGEGEGEGRGEREEIRGYMGWPVNRCLYTTKRCIVFVYWEYVRMNEASPSHKVFLVQRYGQEAPLLPVQTHADVGVG